MDFSLTRERASKIGGWTAAASLAVAIAGAVAVQPIVIGVGTLGAAFAAYVKLSANGHNSPRYTPSNHPMRRATDKT
jgi:hypothetical protein